MGVKRVVVVSAAVLLLMLGIAIVGINLQSGSPQSGGALRAVPSDASVVVRIPGGAGIAQEWIASEAVRGLLGNVKLLPVIDSFALRHPRAPLGHRGEAPNYYLSVHVPKGLPPQWLCTFEVSDAIRDADALREYLFGPAATILSERIYEGVMLRAARVRVAGQELECYYGVADGLGLVSTSSLLVESAVRTLKSGFTLVENHQFKSLLDASTSSSGIVFFVQPLRFFEALGDALAGQWIWGAKALSNWTPWLMLEAQVRRTTLAASGVSYLTDSVRCDAQLMQKAAPMRMVAPSVLPLQCDFFLRWADARAGETLTTLPSAEKYAPAGYSASARKQDMQLLQGVGSGEIVLAHLPFPELQEKDRWVVLVSCQSPSLAVQKLSNELCRKSEPLRREVDRGQSVEIFQTQRPDYFRNLLSPLFGDSAARFFMAAEKSVLFASSEHTLERVAIANLRRQTLSNDETFGAFQKRLKDESNFSLYLAPTAGGGEAAKLFARRPKDTAAWGWLSQLRGGILQLTAGRGIIFYNLVAQQGNAKEQTAGGMRVEWEMRLDAPVAGRPLLMESHVAKGKEILTQDTLGNLYLISGKGQTLWKRPLNELILGEPQQIDLYRNGKLQYAFATPKAIWVIDRNGNNVSGFPLHMPQRITAPLGLFDYDSNRNYRFMVCLEDCTARIYDAAGKRLSDFAPAKFDMPITQQPLHIRTAGKDFIVVSDKQRLYLLSRRGAERLATSEPVACLDGAPVVLWRASNDLATVDASGTLCLISMESGDVRRVALQGKGTPRAAQLIKTALQGETCVVTMYGNQLHFYCNDGKRIASRTFASALQPELLLFQFAQHDWRIGVREAEGGRLWLVDLQGNVVKGFPVVGKTGFTIGHLEGSSARFNLITGGAPSLLINYLIPE